MVSSGRVDVNAIEKGGLDGEDAKARGTCPVTCSDPQSNTSYEGYQDHEK
jgi:hypothetical protein